MRNLFHFSYISLAFFSCALWWIMHSCIYAIFLRSNSISAIGVHCKLHWGMRRTHGIFQVVRLMKVLTLHVLTVYGVVWLLSLIPRYQPLSWFHVFLYSFIWFFTTGIKLIASISFAVNVLKPINYYISHLVVHMSK